MRYLFLFSCFWLACLHHVKTQPGQLEPLGDWFAGSPESFNILTETVAGFGESNRLLDQLLHGGVELSPVLYTKEQADNFVRNGFKYLSLKVNRGSYRWYSLAMKEKPNSETYVEELDGVVPRPRGKTKLYWRWLPLIDRFDANNQPVFHKSKVSNGEEVISPDRIRLDFVGDTRNKIPLPTAIVRPTIAVQLRVSRPRYFALYYYPNSYFTLTLKKIHLQQPLYQEQFFWNRLRSDMQLWIQDVPQDDQENVWDRFRLLSTPKLLSNIEVVDSNKAALWLADQAARNPEWTRTAIHGAAPREAPLTQPGNVGQNFLQAQARQARAALTLRPTFYEGEPDTTLSLWHGPH